MSKSEQLKRLYSEYTKQFINEEIVLGSGNLDAKILLIGEAPGKDEVKQLKPFVGMAGKNLSEFLDIIGLERESIFITNTIKYRLSTLSQKTGKLVNRPATKDDIEKNRMYLWSEVNIIAPKYIITLGNVPLKAIMCDTKTTIGMVHGSLKKINLEGLDYSIYPLYHPASIIYNRDLKDTYINDITNFKTIISKEL